MQCANLPPPPPRPMRIYLNLLQASYRPYLEFEIKVLRGRDITFGYADYCEYKIVKMLMWK